MGQLSNRINNLSESETIQMARMSRELKSQGMDIIDLSLGEPDFDTPEHIKNAAKAAIDEGYTHYTPVSGFQELREAIAEKFKRDNNLDYQPEQVVVSTGAKQSLANIVLSILNPGDEVLLPNPYWVSYREIIKLAEGKIIDLPTTIDGDFKVNPQQLEAAITPRSRIFLFSSPCNPTGTVYSKSELREITEIIAKHPDIYIISDEIYEYINFTDRHESIAQFDFIKDRVITVNGVSKGFAMTGWRIGYIGAPQWIAEACDKMQGQITSGACAISQRAALTAVSADLGPTYAMKAAFLKRRDLVLELLKDVPHVKTNLPQGAFYVFPNVSYYFGKSDGEFEVTDINAFCMYILNKANVSVVTGKAFGNPNCFRFSYATTEENIIEAVRRIKIALADLR